MKLEAVKDPSRRTHVRRSINQEIDGYSHDHDRNEPQQRTTAGRRGDQAEHAPEVQL